MSGKNKRKPAPGRPPRRIEWRRLDEVARAPRNPRKHHTARIQSSVDTHGFLEPLVEDSRTGKLVSGHGRLDDLLARCERGDTPPEGIRQDSDDMYLVPVVVGWRSRSDADAAHALVAVNQRGEWGEDVDNLLRDIAEAGLSLDGTEFDTVDVDALLAGLPSDPSDAVGDATDIADIEVCELTDERAAELDEAIPEPPRDPTTKKGERITLGPHTLYCDDCIAIMRAQPDQSVDAIVTDPPYGIDFMGKGWDNAVPGPAWAEQCFRVLKPGAHLIAFAATRTLHQLTTVLEQAGFEIRDIIGWLRWTGFPKSHDVSKAIDRERGAERKVVGVRHDGVGNTARSLHKREGFAASRESTFEVTAPATDDARRWNGWGTALKPALEPCILVRKPLEKGLTVAQNVLKWDTGALNIDACRYPYGDRAWPGPQERPPDGDPNARASPTGATWGGALNARVSQSHDLGRWPANVYYCPGASRTERNEGEAARNTHPTVKPVKLMSWLLRLVTPPGGVVFEPFGGSGTTLVAAVASGLDATLIATELEPAYCDIIRARVEGALRGA